MQIEASESRASTAIEAIKSGNVDLLRQILADHPELVKAHIMSSGDGRTLLHILADWPGRLPNNLSTAKILIDAGCDVNAKFIGHHAETPLHWAASNDDVQLLDALLDAGADINAGGGVIAETPLADARAFLQLQCAHRLVERGATVTINDAATLGLLSHVEAFFSQEPAVSDSERDCALWNSCHGGQLDVAKFLLQRGADINFIPSWENMTPLDAAERSKAEPVANLLREQGGKRQSEL